nr:LOW QUALITY PROTEIN: uncharacterized protein LOC105489819 [Macaca nemestrina]
MHLKNPPNPPHSLPVGSARNKAILLRQVRAPPDSPLWGSGMTHAFLADLTEASLALCSLISFKCLPGDSGKSGKGGLGLAECSGIRTSVASSCLSSQQQKTAFFQDDHCGPHPASPRKGAGSPSTARARPREGEAQLFSPPASAGCSGTQPRIT